MPRSGQASFCPAWGNAACEDPIILLVRGYIQDSAWRGVSRPVIFRPHFCSCFLKQPAYTECLKGYNDGEAKE
jgi:hypothetical protein